MIPDALSLTDSNLQRGRRNERFTDCFDHGCGDRCHRTYSGELRLQLFQLAARTERWTARDALVASGRRQWQPATIGKWRTVVVPVSRSDRQRAIHVRWPRVLPRTRRPIWQRDSWFRLQPAVACRGAKSQPPQRRVSSITRRSGSANALAWRLPYSRELHDRGLKLNTQIECENTGTRPLPYGLGTHAYFRLPLSDGADPEMTVVTLPATK